MKERRGKRLICLLLAVVTVFSLLPVSALADGSEDYGLTLEQVGESGSKTKTLTVNVYFEGSTTPYTSGKQSFKYLLLSTTKEVKVSVSSLYEIYDSSVPGALDVRFSVDSAAKNTGTLNVNLGNDDYTLNLYIRSTTPKQITIKTEYNDNLPADKQNTFSTMSLKYAESGTLTNLDHAGYTWTASVTDGDAQVDKTPLGLRVTGGAANSTITVTYTPVVKTAYFDQYYAVPVGSTGLKYETTDRRIAVSSLNITDKNANATGYVLKDGVLTDSSWNYLTHDGQTYEFSYARVIPTTGDSSPVTITDIWYDRDDAKWYYKYGSGTTRSFGDTEATAGIVNFCYNRAHECTWEHKKDSDRNDIHSCDCGKSEKCTFATVTTTGGDTYQQCSGCGYAYATVTFDVNDGDESSTPAPKQVELKETLSSDGPSTALKGTLGALPTTATRTGYTLGGWYFSGGEPVATIISEITGDTTLHALWKPNTYNIAFELNGGTGEFSTMQYKEYDESVTLPTEVPAKEGTVFLGWKDEASESGEVYQPGDSVKNLTAENGATVTLTAQWVPTVTGTVKFVVVDTDGYAIPVNDLTLGLGAWKLKYKNATAAEWADRWSSWGDVDTDALNVFGWENGNEDGRYSVNVTSPLMLGYSALYLNVNVADATADSGYKILGLAEFNYTDKTGNVGQLENYPNIIYIDRDNYVACFKYVMAGVTFDANAGEDTVTNMPENKYDNGVYDYYTLGATVTIPDVTPTREHYRFMGWYTAPTGGDEVTNSTEISENTTLYAHWDRVSYVVDLSQFVLEKKFESKYGATLENETFTFAVVVCDNDFPACTSYEEALTAEHGFLYKEQKTVTLSTGESVKFTFEPLTFGYGTEGVGIQAGKNYYRIYFFEVPGDNRDIEYASEYLTAQFTYSPPSNLIPDGTVNWGSGPSGDSGGEGVVPISLLSGENDDCANGGEEISASCTFTNYYTAKNLPPFRPVKPGVPTVKDPEPTVTLVGLNSTDHVAYIVGHDTGLVDPNGIITRAEAATIFYRLMDDDFRAKYWSGSSSFTDVSDSAWYHVAVATLENAGIIRDTAAGGAFRPNDPITRAELAVMAAQFASVTGGDIPASSFSDVAETYWAYDEIALVEYAGWIEGWNGAFRPDDSLTRAECVTVINRMLQRGAEADGMLTGMVTFPDNANPNAWYYAAIQEAANSHTYVRGNILLSGEKFLAEKWVALTPAPDWAAMEQAWADAGRK